MQVVSSEIWSSVCQALTMLKYYYQLHSVVSMPVHGYFVQITSSYQFKGKHNRWKIQQVEANKLAFWKRGRVEFRTTNWDKFNQLPDRDWNPEHAHTKLAPQPIHHGIKFNIRHDRPYFSSLICRRFLLHTETRSEERARQKNNRGECKKQQKFRKLQTLLF